MATYDKPKRKNAPAPPPAILKMLSSFVSGILYYGLVVPTRWTWRQCGRFLNWMWRQFKGLSGWVWRQTGAFFSLIWRGISFVMQKTVFAPFIAVGRLLGFVANAVPKGLSAQEAEIYQRINRHYRRQKRWYLHVISFLIGMVILWVSELTNWYEPRTGMVITMTLVWLLILGTHRLWMNLGKSEDNEIGEALQHLRQSQQTVYYEEEIYDERPYDTSHLEERASEADEWLDEEYIQQAAKAKRHHQ